MTNPEVNPGDSQPDTSPVDRQPESAQQPVQESADHPLADHPADTAQAQEHPAGDVNSEPQAADSSDSAGSDQGEQHAHDRDAAEPGATKPEAEASGQASSEPGQASAQRNQGEANAEDMSAFEADVEDSQLAKTLAQVDQLGDDLAHARADLYNLQQEYAGYVRRSKDAASGHRKSGQREVIEALLGVLDDIAAARAAGDLEGGPFAAIATKLEDTLKTKFQVERYGEAGDLFDPQHHEALLAQEKPEVDQPIIGQVLQPGYRMGDTVLRATKVMVHNPES